MATKYDNSKPGTTPDQHRLRGRVKDRTVKELNFMTKAFSTDITLSRYILEMGRKDTQMHSLPVDHYRKQIGTQYRRRTTSEAKEERKHAELKSNTPKLYQDIRVVLSGFAGMVLLAYIMIYVWLSNRNVE